MASYLPRYIEGDSVTVTASATIVGGQLVTWAGAVAGDAQVGVAGVAGNDAVSGQPVTVWRVGGPHLGTASGAIAVNDPLCSAAAGQVRKWTTGTDAVAARCGTAASAAANAASVTYALHGV